jgi:hypothetical protein
MFRTCCTTVECGYAPASGGRMAPGGIEPPQRGDARPIWAARVGRGRTHLVTMRSKHQLLLELVAGGGLTQPEPLARMRSRVPYLEPADA